MVRIVKAEIMEAELPLKSAFKHAITARTSSGSVFVKLFLEDGTTGYGEALPRKYVTGETQGSVMKTLESAIELSVLGKGLESYNDAAGFIDGIQLDGGAARSALELAILDAYGRHFGKPVTALMGKDALAKVVYSGVIHTGSAADVVKKCILFRVYGLNFVKIKVGAGADDVERVAAARKVLGGRADIRLDANCSWTAREAIDNLAAMRPYGVSAVEQPVRADDREGLRRVTVSVPETVVADESLCTLQDARDLARIKACGMFNIRISKCGGLINSMRIADIARANGIAVQLGCQVGESGLLSAAGWRLAAAFGDFRYCEGAYGRYLLKRDITKEDVTFGPRGVLRPVVGPGIGATVIDRELDRCVTARCKVGQ